MTQPGTFVDANWEKMYALLRRHDPDLYKRSVETAEAICLQYNVTNSKLAAAIETGIVFAVCDALDITP